VEYALRGIGLAALIALAVRLWIGSMGSGGSQGVTTQLLDSALAAWTAAPPSRATVNASTVPNGQQRDWLVALRRTDLAIEWTTGDSSGGGLVVEAGPLAASPALITALGAPGSSVVLDDDLGRLDSTATGRDGIARWRASPLGAARAGLGTSTAIAVARDSLLTRPVLVLGQAGWESKFVVTALEEAGWSVSARLAVAPGAVVRQGPPVRIDTSSLSAVVVLDSTAVLDRVEIARFVNEGGGLIASGAGSNHPALRTLLPSRARAASTGAVGALLGPSPREGLFSRTFAVREGAVALERRGDAPVIVGRRVGAGRVIVTGYDDTWRLRMAPPDDNAPEMHRAWWSSLVAGAAHSILVARDAGSVDEAPFAATIEALGPPVRASGTPGESSWPWDVLLAAIAALALLSEWLSRRLRGVP